MLLFPQAPLLIGCDVPSMSNDALSILSNEDVIAINQDSLGKQGHKMKTMDTNEIWAGPLANGDIAAILLNRGDNKSTITAKWSDIGGDDSKVAAGTLHMCTCTYCVYRQAL